MATGCTGLKAEGPTPLPSFYSPLPSSARAEAKTNLPAAPARTIPARMMIIWEDTTAWPPAFRRQMEERFSYDDEDFDRALLGRGAGDAAGGGGDKDHGAIIAAALVQLP